MMRPPLTVGENVGQRTGVRASAMDRRWGRRGAIALAVVVGTALLAACDGPRNTNSRYGVVLYNTNGLDLTRRELQMGPDLRLMERP